jgi:hypothetical protein
MVWRAARPAMGSSGACEDAPGFELGVGAFAGGRAGGRERSWRPFYEAGLFRPRYGTLIGSLVLV